MSTKQGRIFEELVYFLNSNFHKSAKVSFDVKLLDKITGQQRQIDILVELADGPSVFRAIIEARERSRPVGVGYVEEVRSKKESVGADRAIIVSNKGFAKGAKTKAEFYGIATYSLRQALQEDWTLTIRKLKTISVETVGANLTFYFLTDDNFVIDPHPSLKERMSADGMKVVIAAHPSEKTVITAQSLVDYAYKEMNVQALVDSDRSKRHPISVSIAFPLSDGFAFLDKSGVARPFTKIALHGEVWRKVEEAPVKVKQYKDEKTGEVIAEIVTTDSPDLPVDMVFEYPQRTGQERRILFKKRP